MGVVRASPRAWAIKPSRAVCAQGSDLLKGRKQSPCCCFRDGTRFSVCPGILRGLGTLRWPVGASGPHMEPSQQRCWKRGKVAGWGSPPPWGACGLLHCVSWTQRPTPLVLVLWGHRGAVSGCQAGPEIAVTFRTQLGNAWGREAYVRPAESS